jgi:hypothetical protein
MIILLSIIIPKRLDPYYQADITRRDLVILREEKQRNNNRNIIATIILPFLLPPSQPFSPPFTPEPLESEIRAKYLNHKTLDLPDLMEPEPNAPRKQFTPRLLGRTTHQSELRKSLRKTEDILLGAPRI